jgi:DNA-binding transcriptional LysR family regulator
MELRDLRTFLQVLDSGSITAGATELNLAQSAVSAAVARLEREFGVRLLERRPDGVRPTSAGVDLAGHASALVARSTQAQLDMAAHRGLSKGQVRLGMLPSIVPVLLTPLLRAVRGEHPGLRVHVEEALMTDLVGRLRSDRLDAVLLWEPSGACDLESAPLARLPLLVVAAPDHPLATRRGVDGAELSEDAWIAFPPGGPGHQWIEQAGHAWGFPPRITLELESLAEIKAFVQAGIGITLLPEPVVRLELASGALRQLSLRLQPRPAILGYLRQGDAFGGVAVKALLSMVPAVVETVVSARRSSG